MKLPHRERTQTCGDRQPFGFVRRIFLSFFLFLFFSGLLPDNENLFYGRDRSGFGFDQATRTCLRLNSGSAELPGFLLRILLGHLLVCLLARRGVGLADPIEGRGRSASDESSKVNQRVLAIKVYPTLGSFSRRD